MPRFSERFAEAKRLRLLWITCVKTDVGAKRGIRLPFAPFDPPSAIDLLDWKECNWTYIFRRRESQYFIGR